VRKSLVFGISFVLFVLSVTPVFAHHQQQVLGDSTTTINATIPPTAEGPGLILPDSPLFFLDKLKQNARLFFAFTPEAKAKVHTEIAGERMAELRLMLAKNKKDGVQTDLREISDNLDRAAAEVRDAGLTGRDVSKLARDINASIKAKQQTLDILEAQTTGDLKVQVQATTASLLPAKVTVEDALPANELENEIRDDLQRQVRKRLEQASGSARQMEHDIQELQKQASSSAKEAIQNREAMLKEAIEAKNSVIRREKETELQGELKKQEELFKVNENAAGEARKAMEASHKAAAHLQKADEIRNQSVSGGDSGKH